MPAQVRTAVDRLTGAVRSLALAQRLYLLLAAAALVVAAVGVGGWLARPTMSPLFSGLSGADASAIVDKLSADGVRYELADGGATVLVPQGDLYASRISMAAAGLPANADGTGYSLLDDLPVTASDFQQQTAYRRAMEGELARTVAAIDGIETASVRLALPEESVFVAAKADPTASVFVRTRAGVTLTSDQVQAIVHLVSAGIEGMKPTDVAVVDSSGEVLSAVGTGTAGGALGGRQAGDYEARIQAAVEKLLDPLVGPGRSAVTVTARLNLDSMQRTTEEYSATPGTPPLTSSTTSEQYTGTGTSATGVLGPDNIAVPTGAADGGSYTSTSTDVANPVNKATEVTTSGPGGVEWQSVSVAVDETAAQKLDMAALTQAISAAAGIDATRGDTLSVQKMAFDTTRQDAAQQALAEADATAATQERDALIVKAAVIGAALLLMVLLVALAGRRSRRLRREALDLGLLEAARAAEANVLLEGPPDGLPLELPAAPEPGPAESAFVARRREIEAMADDQPSEVAELLRMWLAAPTGGKRR